jgi:hypothetical protein
MTRGLFFEVPLVAQGAQLRSMLGVPGRSTIVPTMSITAHGMP